MKARIYLVVGLLFVGVVLGILGGCSKEDPKGACCLPNGSCVVDTKMACDSKNGGYHGDNVVCTTELCANDNFMVSGIKNAMKVWPITLLVLGLTCLSGWCAYKIRRMPKSMSITGGPAVPMIALVMLLGLGLGGCDDGKTPSVAIEKVNRDHFMASGKRDPFVADARPSGWSTPFVSVGRFFSEASSYAWYSGCSESVLDPSNGSKRTFYNGQFKAEGISIHTVTMNVDGKDICMSFANVQVYRPAPNTYEQDEVVRFANLAVINCCLENGIYTIEVYSPSGDRHMKFRGPSVERDGFTSLQNTAGQS